MNNFISNRFFWCSLWKWELELCDWTTIGCNFNSELLLMFSIFLFWKIGRRHLILWIASGLFIRWSAISWKSICWGKTVYKFISKI